MRGVSWTAWLEGSRGNESTLHRLKASLRKVVHKVHRKIFLWACRMVGSSRLRVWKLLFLQYFLVKTLHSPAVGPLREEMNVHMKAKAKCPNAFEIYTPSAPLLCQCPLNSTFYDLGLIFLSNQERKKFIILLCALDLKHFLKDGFQCPALDLGGKSEDKRRIRNWELGLGRMEIWKRN